MLVHAVVVAGDGSGANVDACANLSVSQVSEVVGFGALAELDFFRLHKIANVRAFPNFASRAEMAVRAEQSAIRDVGIVQNATRPHQYSVAQSGIVDHAVRAYSTVSSNSRLAK